MPIYIKKELSTNGQPAERSWTIPRGVMARKDLSPQAKLVLAAMDMESFGTGFVTVCDEILSADTGIARTHIADHRKALEKATLIEKFGHPVKRVQRYRLIHPEMQGTGIAPVGVTTKRSISVSTSYGQRCHACGAQLPTKAGVCIVCRKQDRADGEVAAFMRDNPDAAPEIAWIALKSRGSKCGSKEIRRAWQKLATVGS